MNVPSVMLASQRSGIEQYDRARMPMHVRYLVGTNRRAVQAHLRRLRGRLRRTPPCASVVVRPATAPHRAPTLELTHVVLASDLHPSYAPLWPVAKRAWKAITGIHPVLVLVADASAVPPDLAADPDVRVFTPESGLHTAFQAQCIRLLYPALMTDARGVATSDIDMIPMSRRYFHRPLARIDRRHFVCYRDVLLDLEELPICYNVALPATWASVFGIDSLDDVRAKLREWGAGVEYAGTHGGIGWTTDQRRLYEALVDRGRRWHDVWILDDDFTGYRRLERSYVAKWGAVSPEAARGVERRRFSDFHLLRADSADAALNEAILDAAIAAS
jgi:hypothetical protein